MTFNLDYDIAGAVFLVAFYIFLTKQYITDTVSNKMFRRLIYFVLFADLLEIVSNICVENVSAVPAFSVYVLKTVYFIALTETIHVYSAYVRTLICSGDARMRRFDIAYTVICVLYDITCVLNVFTSWYFYIDSERNFVFGKYHILVIAFPLFISILLIGRLFYNRKKLTRSQQMATHAFLVITVVCALLQNLVFKGVLLVAFGAMLGIVFLLFAMEMPTYISVTQNVEELRKSKEQLQIANAKNEETTRMVHELMKSTNWRLDINEKGEVTNSIWGPEFRMMVGESAGDIPESQLWVNLLHPDEREEITEAFARGMLGIEEYDRIYRLKDKSGDYRYYRGTGELLHNESGQVVAYQGVIQDVHEQHVNKILADEKLAVLDKLEKSQDALTRAVHEAQRANQSKSQFLSNMSHDIRTPMNAVIGFTDLALENLDNKEQIKDYLEKIKASGNHLLLLINDILDMGKIESGKITLNEETCNMVEILKTSCSMLNAQANQKKLHLELDVAGITDEYVVCDRLRMNQVLLNCAGNSIKFTPEGGLIRINARQLESEFENRARYEIKILDSGIGMSKEFLSRIFDPFEREKTSTISKIQGTGLGMSITKSLVEMMYGTIDVDSVVGEGTTYTIVLNLQIASKEEIEEELSATSDTHSKEEMLSAVKGKKALIVDDNEINRTVASLALSSFEMLSEEVVDGKEAVDRLKSCEPTDFDIVLMDIQMPVMDGYEATDAIRGLLDKDIASIPIVAMTADAFDEDKKKCEAHGMNGHVSKPFEMDELLEIIYRCTK